VAGQDTVAVDATCCRIMGIDSRIVRCLRLAETTGQTGEEWVRQIGEAPARVRTGFELLPELSEYRLRRG
jgi:uncharacterized protein (DUF362 family)